MKKVIAFLSILAVFLVWATPAQAQPSAADQLLAVGIPPEQASAIVSIEESTSGDYTITSGDVIFATTDRGVGSDADTKTVKLCGGTAGAGCDAEGVGAWIAMEGTDFGGTTEGGGIQIEGGAGDATSDVTIATNHDDADILLRGGSTQATRVTVEGDTGNVVLATGHLDLETTGKTLILEDGTAASTCIGNATANGTTAVTTATTCAETGDYVFISRSSAPSGTAQCWATNIVDGTSFDLDCSGAETGTFHWVIIKGQ